MKTCVYCGSQNKKHKSNCTQCGAPLALYKGVSNIALDEAINCNAFSQPKSVREELIYGGMTVFPNAWYPIIGGFSPFLLLVGCLCFANIIPWIYFGGIIGAVLIFGFTVNKIAEMV